MGFLSHWWDMYGSVSSLESIGYSWNKIWCSKAEQLLVTGFCAAKLRYLKFPHVCQLVHPISNEKIHRYQQVPSQNRTFWFHDFSPSFLGKDGMDGDSWFLGDWNNPIRPQAMKKLSRTAGWVSLVEKRSKTSFLVIRWKMRLNIPMDPRIQGSKGYDLDQFGGAQSIFSEGTWIHRV